MRIFAIVFFAASAAFAQGMRPPAPPPPPSEESGMPGVGRDVVIVSGNASIDMTPDVVLFTIGITTEGKNVREVVAANNATSSRIMTVLKNAGVAPEELRTSQFHVAPLDDDEHKSGYRVTNEIGVTRKTVKDAGELVTAAIEAGANQVRGPEFSVADEKRVQDRCIEIAFADARQKARKLATLSQRRLGKVLAVTDGSSSPFERKYPSPGLIGGEVGGFLSLAIGVHSAQCGVTVAFHLD